MRTLYVDNYRGFASTWIPIADVNFLVGENSTGKTSILSLINVLGSFDFWFHQEFNNTEVELGAFRDILSASRPDADSFSVGVIECADDGVFPSDDQCTFLMTFVQQSGMPRLKEWSFVANDQQIRVSFRRKVARYSIDAITPCEDLPSTLDKTFRTWLEEPYTAARGYRQLSQTEVPLNVPLFVADILRAHATGTPEERSARDRGVRYPGPRFASDGTLTWLAPVRSKPARMYSGLKATYSPEGEHTPHQIRRILARDKPAQRFHDFTQSFGKESHLFDRIYVRSFGRSLTSAFELGITLDGARIVVSDVGYGVSQALPILVEMFPEAQRGLRWYALQQPEVHLHPRAQAALGELILNLSVRHDQRFLVETHSDYLIDRFRIGLRESDPSPVITSQVLFFERSEGGNRVHAIPIAPDGSYSESQPESFRGFFIHEQLRLLGL
jgi:hypothetical protein